MQEPQQLEPIAEAEQLELLPQSAPERQYCVFRTGRERFCFSGPEESFAFDVAANVNGTGIGDQCRAE